MNLKDIGNKFQEKFLGSKGEKTPEEVVKEEVIEPIQDENIEISDEETIEKIIILLSKCSKERRKAIIEELRKAKEISSDILIESAVQAADSEEVSDEVAVDLAKQSSDKTAMGILENAEISEDDRLAIIRTLKDNEKKENAICKELKMSYGAMKNQEQQSEFVGRIQKIIGIFKRTDKINEELYKIVAKNLAFMYQKTNGGMDLYLMEQLVPIHEMIRVKMPEKIGQEYANLLKEGEENKFDLSEVKGRFLDRMIKEIHRKAIDEKQPDSTFMKYIGEVDEEESELLMKCIQKYNPDISEKEMGKILRIAKGEENESIYEPKRKKQNNSIINEEEIDVDIIRECIDSGLIKILGEMSEQERKISLTAMTNSLEKRVRKEKNVQMLKNAKVAPREEVPKVKKQNLKEILIDKSQYGFYFFIE